MLQSVPTTATARRNTTAQTITGYQVSETESVKVTDITQAGTLLAGVGTRGVSNVSGLSFTVANQDALSDQARAQGDHRCTDQGKGARKRARASRSAP